MATISQITNNDPLPQIASAPKSAPTGGDSRTGGTSPAATDSVQVSPLAQAASTLDQLQQSDPAKHAEVTQQIATNLQSAAQKAQASGDTESATRLNKLSSDFAEASKTGKSGPPASATVAHHSHRHHSKAAAGYASVSSTTQSDPSTIIQDTLSQAGVAATTKN